MKAQFYKGGLIVEPETPEEIAQFQLAFPKHYLKSSKVAKIKEFTNRFGEAEGSETYLYVSGIKEAGEHLGEGVSSADLSEEAKAPEADSAHFQAVAGAGVLSEDATPQA